MFYFTISSISENSTKIVGRRLCKYLSLQYMIVFVFFIVIGTMRYTKSIFKFIIFHTEIIEQFFYFAISNMKILFPKITLIYDFFFCHIEIDLLFCVKSTVNNNTVKIAFSYHNRVSVNNKVQGFCRYQFFVAI